MNRRLPAAVLLAALAALAPPEARATWPENGAEVLRLRSWINVRATHSTDGFQFYVDSNYPGAGPEIVSISASGVKSWESYASNQPVLAGDGAAGAFLLNYQSPSIRLRRLDVNGLWHPGPSSTEYWNVANVGATVWSILSDGSQGAYVVWHRSTPPNVRVRHFDGEGNNVPGWPDTGQVAWSWSGAGGIESLAMTDDGEGGLYVFGYRTTGTTAQRFQSNGVVHPQWPGVGRTYTPAGSMLHLGGGSLGRIWTDTQVRFRRVLPSGAYDPAWPAAGVAIAPAASVIAIPDGEGGAWFSISGRLHRRLSDGSLPAGFPAEGIPVGGDGLIAKGRDGGVIECWVDAGDLRIRWLDGRGVPESGEPAVPRVIPSTAVSFRLDRIDSDDDGTAYVVATSFPEDYSEQRVMLYEVEPLPFAPTSVGERTSAIALSPPWPNPARDAFTVRFTLERDANAAVELFDVGGRVVRSRIVRGAGEHVERFGQLESLDPRLYFLRVREGATTRITRVALTR